MMDFRTLRPKCALLAPVCLLVLGAAGNVAADTIDLGWDPSGSTVGYKVHVGVQSGSYTQHVDAGTSTTFAFTAATAGQQYCFAVSAYTLSSRVDGPNSSEVCGYSNAPPTLVNPGTRTSTVGQPTSLQLQGADPASQPLTYSTTGLPPGLSVMSSTGYISGTGTTAGTYSVTARVSDGVLSTSQTFSWTMTATSGGGGTTPPPTGGTDTTRPTVTISSPTSASTYAINASSLALSGTTSDNVGVTQVRWENDQMNLRGVANGLTNWTTSVPLQVGSNTIYITAIDAVGNEGVDILTVSVSSTGGGTADTTKPTLSIGTPTTGSTYLTTQSTINLSGSAADNRGVAQVAWMNSAGGNGVANGTTSWAITNLPLQSGTNVISVTALDAAGNAATATLTVTRSTTPPPPTLSVERLGSSSMRLSWTYTSWPSVDVYRNGFKVKTSSNDGSTNDNVDRRGNYTYKVCAPGSTTVCSNSVSICN
jgi:hypothetical protein